MPRVRPDLTLSILCCFEEEEQEETFFSELFQFAMWSNFSKRVAGSFELFFHHGLCLVSVFFSVLFLEKKAIFSPLFFSEYIFISSHTPVCIVNIEKNAMM